jgi:hypothetical protein
LGGGSGNLALQVYDNATNQNYEYSFAGFLQSALLGGVFGGLFIKAGRSISGTQQVAHWNPSRYPVDANSALRSGDWVMIGNNGALNYAASGIGAKLYPPTNSFTPDSNA